MDKLRIKKYTLNTRPTYSYFMMTLFLPKWQLEPLTITNVAATRTGLCHLQEALLSLDASLKEQFIADGRLCRGRE